MSYPRGATYLKNRWYFEYFPCVCNVDFNRILSVYSCCGVPEVKGQDDAKDPPRHVRGAGTAGRAERGTKADPLLQDPAGAGPALDGAGGSRRKLREELCSITETG